MTELSDAMLLDDLVSIEMTADEALNEIHALCRAVSDIDKQVTDAEELLEQLKLKRRELVEKTIPERLRQAQLSKCRLADGTEVTLRDEVFASISDQNHSMAMSWLRDNGFDDIIKNVVSCNFGRGEDDKAKGLIDALMQNNIEFSQRQRVHPATLKAFLKEQLQKGVAIPLDLFGAYMATVARIKSPTKG